jgi:hypothetical protein
MAQLQLDSHKTALVLIDLQNAIVGMTTAPHSRAFFRWDFVDPLPIRSVA